MSRILDDIESPSDVKALNYSELNLLAEEIRERLVEVTSVNGGHLASSLGAVELILGIYHTLDVPPDKVFFDVGHQSYAHMLVTGRRDSFSTLRQYGGISGFPKINESPFDNHDSGHASDSLSTALGYAMARDLDGRDEKVLALIGDASISGGLAFEALNHMGQTQTGIIIILNDNAMSISRNVGAISLQLANARTTRLYQDASHRLKVDLSAGGRLRQQMLRSGLAARDAMKQILIDGNGMLFEEMGIKYIGPLDGHNIHEIEAALNSALRAKGPVLIHAATRKGRGYLPAEERPDIFHGIGAFDRHTGLVYRKEGQAPSYTSVFSRALIAEACENPSIVGISAAMLGGTGMDRFMQVFPKRCFDVGIAEEHAVTFSSGLALAGKLPVVAIYSTFLQRALDEIVTNIALPGLHVVFAIDRAGLVGDDGPTHHGILDISYMRMIPGMTVIAPSDERELIDGLHTALRISGPVAIRYPRGAGRGVDTSEPPSLMPLGKARRIQEGHDVALLALGSMVSVAGEVTRMLEERGLSVSLYDMRFAKPVDEEAIAQAASCRLVASLEEGVVAGGFFDAVCESLAEQGLTPHTMAFGIPDTYPAQGDTSKVMADLGLDADSIFKALIEALETRG